MDLSLIVRKPQYLWVSSKLPVLVDGSVWDPDVGGTLQVWGKAWDAWLVRGQAGLHNGPFLKKKTTRITQVETMTFYIITMLSHHLHSFIWCCVLRLVASWSCVLFVWINTRDLVIWIQHLSTVLKKALARVFRNIVPLFLLRMPLEIKLCGLRRSCWTLVGNSELLKVV